MITYSYGIGVAVQESAALGYVLLPQSLLEEK